MKLIIAEELNRGIFLIQITLFKEIYFLKHDQFFKVKLCEREKKSMSIFYLVWLNSWSKIHILKGLDMLY